MQKSENKQKVICLVVLFGFETKNYFESGLFNKLNKNYKIVILKRKFKSKNFDEFIKKYNLDVTEFDENDFSDFTKIEKYYASSRKAKQRINGIENFNYFKSDRKIKNTDYFLANPIINKILDFLNKVSLKKFHGSNVIDKFYKDKKVTDLLLAGYSSISSVSLTQTAHKNNINIFLTINSWKDFYVNNYIPFVPKKIFAWNSNMKNQILLYNKHIKQESVEVIGNLSFDRFYDYTPINSKEYYAKKYNFDKDRKIILYTMISPRAYDKEKEVIELINLKLIEKYPNEKERPIVILRSNPIDETKLTNEFYTGNNVYYADNYFDASYDNAVFCQLPEGETEWLDFLYYCSLNINIASTVTLESLMMNRAVTNIEFGPDGKKDNILERYSNAPFYKELLNRDDVRVVNNIENCIKKIDYYLSNNPKIESFSNIIEVFDGKSSHRVINIINDCETK